MNDGICADFEPQTYLRERCKRCFKLKSKHEIPSSPKTPEKRRSWVSDGAASPDYETADNMTETSSVLSYKSANSKFLSNARSTESIADDRSMVTAASGSLEFDDERAVTPTEIFDSNHYRTENFRLSEMVSRLKAERQRWLSRRPKPRDSKEETAVKALEERLIEAESLLADYRDENTSLKCELRTHENPLVSDKLNSAEDLCNELMIENEQLKTELRNLETEVDEMKDQYREEEIDEFRELQRELEQNAKNCRVLQFKLRKSERQKEQILAEREVYRLKVEEQRSPEDETEIVEAADSDDGISQSGSVGPNRSRELESELRISKEVSIRLHNELEAAEEKRYKLEDEVFYYKEKLREIQTQNKWRDNRNRMENPNKRVPIVPGDPVPRGDDVSKEMSDILERENDLKEQLRFTEEDLRRTRSQLQETETENEELMEKLSRLSEDRTLSNKRPPPITRSARVLDLEIDNAKRPKSENMDKEGNFVLNSEIEKDLSLLMNRILDLEKRNSELQIQLRKKIAADPAMLRDKTNSVELRKERQRRKELETELREFKQLIAKSDNNKLIGMATKVELLTNQLNMAIERSAVLHKKSLKENSKTDEKYADSLHQRIEELEKEISQLKAKETFHIEKPANQIGTVPTADEIEQCCVVLASVEAHTTRLCKQMEKLDNSQKEERRRSLSKDSGTAIAADLANIMAELQMIHQFLDNHKASYPSLNRRSPTKEVRNIPVEAEAPQCSECHERDEQLEAIRQDIAFYKKKNKELTNQILQTEDRWTLEIEKQNQSFVSKFRQLEAELEESRSRLKEQTEISNAHSFTIGERDRLLDERNLKITQIEAELNEKQRALQEMEREQRSLKEWEIKHRKLENLYEEEKEKWNTEKSKLKTETNSLKKKAEEKTTELAKTRELFGQKEAEWNNERKRLLRETETLRKSSNEPEEEDRSIQSNLNVTGTIVRSMNYRVTRVNDVGVPELQRQLADERQKLTELETKFLSLQTSKDTLESELSKLQESFDKEKEESVHRSRQSEKIRSFELDALQQKFSSRMQIMENTNKSLHTQLVQIRRDRDRLRDQVADLEKRLNAEQKTIESERQKTKTVLKQNNEFEKRTKEMGAEASRLRTEIRLAMDAHKADKKLWMVERRHLAKSQSPMAESDQSTERIASDALNAAEAVQRQYAEYQKFYTKEVARLNARIRELANDMNTKETEFRRKNAALSEQIRILEIDQKNLIQSKEMQISAREVLQTDQDRLLQIVQSAEIQKLSRKYRITAILDRLNSLQLPDSELSNVVAQLKVLKEEDSQNSFATNDLMDSGRDTSSELSPRPPTLIALPLSQRSLSIESSATWDPNYRSVSPVKKPFPYPDPPPNFIHNPDKVVCYDRDGRLHYVPKSLIGLMGRSVSYDRNPQPLMKSTGTLTEESDDEPIIPHRRNGSTGTNILYKIRREELAKGTSPSVRTIARAFESLEKPKSSTKRGFFSIRKSRSVDTNETAERNGTILSGPSLLNRNTTSMSYIDDESGLNSRGGRNPFKNMGSKIVERVRRSLSRSGQTAETSKTETTFNDTSEIEKIRQSNPTDSLNRKKPTAI